MHKKVSRLLIALCLAGAVLSSPIIARAVDTPADSSAKSTETAKPKAKKKTGSAVIGKIDAVDKNAKTITVTTKAGKKVVLQTSATSRFFKDGKPAVFDDTVAAVGENVRATVKAKTSEIVTLRIGAKPAGKAKAKKTTA